MTKETESELKPCPFCDESAYVVEASDCEMFFATCSQCYASVGEGYDRDAMPEHIFRSAEEAIAAWNARPSPEPSVAVSVLREAWDASVMREGPGLSTRIRDIIQKYGGFKEAERAK